METPKDWKGNKVKRGLPFLRDTEGCSRGLSTPDLPPSLDTVAHAGPHSVGTGRSDKCLFWTVILNQHGILTAQACSCGSAWSPGWQGWHLFGVSWWHDLPQHCIRTQEYKCSKLLTLSCAPEKGPGEYEMLSAWGPPLPQGQWLLIPRSLLVSQFLPLK